MAKGVMIGLSKVVYAILSDDPVTGVATYQAPVPVPGAISANINPNVNNSTLFADDGPYEIGATMGEITLELNVADVDLDAQAALLGHTVAGGVLVRKSADTPPFVAVGFKTLKSNGKYRYTWLSKGRFSQSEQQNQTRSDSIQFNTPTLHGNFVKRECDDEWERHIDEDHPNFVQAMADNWFTGPYGGVADTTAPTVSTVVPAANATGILTTATVVWTFNEALALSTLTTGTFLVVKDTDGSNVAGSLSVNAGRTVVTFTPTSALSASTAYRAIATAAVKNLAGLALAAPSVTKFTTA